MYVFIQKLINETDESKILKRASFWNMIASIINSLLSSILLFFITRLSGVYLAGVFSIASAIAYQCLSLGLFGVRNVMTSDMHKEYSFSDYFFLRILSTLLMYLLLLYYSFGKGYSFDKSMVVFTFGIFKSIDAIEDLFHGEYHRNNRLDIASILLTIRYFISVTIFILSFIFTRDLIFTCTLSMIFTIFVFFIENKITIKFFVKEKIILNLKKVKSLFIIVLPICIANYIRMYVCNLPKYAIDANLSESIQTYFNILIMPVFIINLLSEVIFRPYITKLSTFWLKHAYNDFIKLVFKQLLIILLITIIVVIGGYVVGLHLLEIVYNIQLSQYMGNLILLLIAGGLNTAGSFLTLVLTIQREQNKLMIVYAIATIFAIILSKPLILRFEILGASLLYFMICFVFFIAFLILTILKVYFEKKEMV